MSRFKSENHQSREYLSTGTREEESHGKASPLLRLSYHIFDALDPVEIRPFFNHQPRKIIPKCNDATLGVVLEKLNVSHLDNNILG